MTRAELLESLAVERMTNPWWVTKTSDQPADDDLTTARRRRQLAADFEAHEKTEQEAR